MLPAQLRKVVHLLPHGNSIGPDQDGGPGSNERGTSVLDASSSADALDEVRTSTSTGRCKPPCLDRDDTGCAPEGPGVPDSAAIGPPQPLCNMQECLNRRGHIRGPIVVNPVSRPLELEILGGTEILGLAVPQWIRGPGLAAA